jgi:hypothetical protein
MRRAFVSGIAVSAAIVGMIIGCSSEENAATHPPASTPEAGGGGDTGPGGDSAGTCLADTGDPPDCDPLDNGCGDVCNGAHDNYKAGVAREIATCLAALPDCDDDTKVRGCFEGAIARACDEAGLSLFCSPLVNACAKDAGFDAGNTEDAGDGGKKEAGAPPPKSSTPFDEPTCENVMRALNADGRQNLAGCVNDGNVGDCTYDPGDCIDQIKR